MKITFSWDTRLFVIIPTITLEDFSPSGGMLHVVFRFGPFAMTVMRKPDIQKAKNELKERLKELDRDT